MTIENSTSQTNHSRPIKYCYWVVPGQFLAGEYPRSIEEEPSMIKVNRLLESGVSTFIDLTEEGELLPYLQLIKGAAHQRFSIKDLSVPESTDYTEKILDAIDDSILRGKIVYLHCWGGVGRTGTIVGCWLSRHGYKGEKALERLRELWRECPKSASRRSPETDEQVNYILKWIL